MVPMRVLLSLCIVMVIVAGAGAAELFRTESIPPKLRLEFSTQLNSDRDVYEFFVQFARAEGLTVVDGTSRMPLKDGRPIFNMELQRGKTAIVNVTNIVRSEQYLVFAYELRPDISFAGIASRLTDRLKEKWPSARPYDDQ